MASAPLNKIETAHQMYKDGKYKEALGCYTEALSVAKTKPQRISLHSNIAACFLKLHNFKKAAEECTSVLELDHDHTGALMLRAQTLVTLKEYHSALFDVNRLIELNPSSEVYRNLETRLRTQLSLAPIPESEAEIEEEEEEDEEDTTVYEHEEEEQSERGDTDMMIGGTPEKNELNPGVDDIIPKTPEIKDSSAMGMDKIVEPRTTIASEVIAQAQKKATEPRKTIASEVIAQVQRRTESRKTITAEVIAQAQRKVEPRKTAATEVTAQAQKIKESPEEQTKSWQAIPKPKGHSALDYARWDRVEEDSSEDDDEDDEESQPQYRFRVKTIGVRSVK